MNIIRKDLGKVERLDEKKIDEMLQMEEQMLVCIPCMKHKNIYKSVLSEDNQFNKILLVLKMSKNDAGYVVDVPEIGFGNIIGDGFVEGFVERIIDVNEVPVYTITPEIIDVALNSENNIYIDDEENAYYEVEEYQDVYVLVGERRVYKGKSYKKEKDVNGVFLNEEDAVKAGEMLENYGKLNDIEYKKCNVEKFSIM